MKKAFILFLTIVFWTTAKAQIIPGRVIFLDDRKNPDGQISMEIDNLPVNFEFLTYDDFRNGAGGINSGCKTSVRITSKNGWKFDFMATRAFLHQDGIHSVGLDNVGLSVDVQDKKQFALYLPDGPVELSYLPTTLISGHKWHGNGHVTILFDIIWEMGTQRGAMNKKSLLEQNLKSGLYTTTVEFIISESL